MKKIFVVFVVLVFSGNSFSQRIEIFWKDQYSFKTENDPANDLVTMFKGYIHVGDSIKDVVYLDTNHNPIFTKTFIVSEVIITKDSVNDNRQTTLLEVNDTINTTDTIIWYESIGRSWGRLTSYGYYVPGSSNLRKRLSHKDNIGQLDEMVIKDDVYFDVLIYPVFVTDEITIKVNNKGNFRLYNLQGKLVYSKEIDVINVNSNISLHSLSSGMYVSEYWIGDKKVKQKKIIKE